ncbi:MAG: NrfD/PsrC family molybdoenzyme membrane anchor subunit [Hyphomicrobiaceae bacterium]|nr:NrfD/PsrC family molybdoenzyme membrane anchor subunit [Hyphomicrobiaceae bacterium]
MARITYRKLDDHSTFFWVLLVINALVIAVGLGAAYYMEHHGHHVTGMNNAVVWGTPHVFAVFLIVAASGALNVASISSVFGKAEYKPFARLSGLLAITLLVGGLAVLVLDLGRPDRLTVAMTTYNFKSIFAWNIYLYTGFIVIVAVYLFTMMDRELAKRPAVTQSVGWFAFGWRLALTTGTGSIFGFLAAREAYDSAIMAPLFIAASFLYGLAFMVIVLVVVSREAGEQLLDEDMVGRFSGLMMLFSLAVLYFTAIKHLTNLYASEHHGIEAFILRDGGVYTALFWGGHVVVGNLLPLAILLFARRAASPISPRHALTLASVLAAAGGFAFIYVTIIGGQAYPLDLFPGMEVSSPFLDGQVSRYAPTLPELLLGLAGVSIAMLATGLALKLLPFLPKGSQGATAPA